MTAACLLTAFVIAVSVHPPRPQDRIIGACAWPTGQTKRLPRNQDLLFRNLFIAIGYEREQELKALQVASGSAKIENTFYLFAKADKSPIRDCWAQYYLKS